MRRAIIRAAVLLLSAMFAASDAAAPAIEVRDLHLEVTVPQPLAAVGRDTKEDSFPSDIYPEETLTDVQERFVEEGIYLECMSEDGRGRIQLTMTENDQTREVYDLALYDGKTLEQIGEFLRQSYAQTQYKAADMSVIERDDATFFCTEMAAKLNSPYCCRQYYTVINGQEICLTMYYSEREIPEADRALLEEMFDSLVFTEVSAPDGAYSAGSMMPETFWGTVWASLREMFLPALMLAAFLATVGGYRYFSRRRKG